jgi:hypothetical protein
MQRLANWLHAGVSLTAIGALAIAAPGARAQQPAQWNYGFVNGVSTATYAGNVNAKIAGTPVSVLSVPGTNCASGSSVNLAVNALATQGYLSIFLPANCTYTPATNTTPANVQIIGEDWNSSIVSSTDRTDNSKNISIGPHAKLQNVAILDYFCDNQANPQGTQKICPIGMSINAASSANEIENWAYASLYIVNNQFNTGPTGAVSSDQPEIGVIQNSTGDGIFSQTNNTSGVNNRIVTNGVNDIGIYVLNGAYSPSTSAHYGIFVKEFQGNNNGYASVYVDRSASVSQSDIVPSIYVTDADSSVSTLTSASFQAAIFHQSSGPVFNVYQATTPFSGNVFNVNVGNGGGTFSGNFENFQIAGSTVYSVSSAGKVTASQYASGASSGVSCSAGTVSLATLVVTNGIVTHC